MTTERNHGIKSFGRETLKQFCLIKNSNRRVNYSALQSKVGGRKTFTDTRHDLFTYKSNVKVSLAAPHNERRKRAFEVSGFHCHICFVSTNKRRLAAGENFLVVQWNECSPLLNYIFVSVWSWRVIWCVNCGGRSGSEFSTFILLRRRDEKLFPFLKSIFAYYFSCGMKHAVGRVARGVLMPLAHPEALT